MTKLDENQIIDILQKGTSKKHTHEDVETFRHGSKNMVVAVDTLVYSTDVPPGMKMQEISRKAVAACVSDFAAKGTRPKFGIISVTVPRKFSKKQAVELSKGFQRASREFRVKILGGDTNEGMELSISVSLYGMTQKIVPRKGAREGDMIFVTGHFGNTAAGLELLLNRRKSGIAKIDAKYRNAFCNPKPRLEFGVKASKYMSSSMDSSDGLAKTLHEMAAQSGKRFCLKRLPFEGTLSVFAQKNRIPVERLVLFGGEEYEMVFTAPENHTGKIKRAAKNSKVPITEIGEVRRGGGVILEQKDRDKKIPNNGWTHLR